MEEEEREERWAGRKEVELVLMVVEKLRLPRWKRLLGWKVELGM